MAAVNASTPVHVQEPGQPTSQQPETPQALKNWWTGFKKRTKKDVSTPVVQRPTGIFGVPLQESIKYANVAISMDDENGKSFTYGYVPIVVAKCGVFLKEKATEVEGIFRLSGSSKRIKELQTIFDSPDKYGKGLDWTGYTVHDAANVLRRYLNQLPQPIVPLNLYERFRDPLRHHQAQAVGDIEATDDGNFDFDGAIATYQRLIVELPPLNRQLLLYILDLLAIFAARHNKNLMTAANLAAIFQPGMISHPSHDMSPADYRLSQDVVIFLIDNQDNFLFGMNGTALDEKTVQEVQNGRLLQRPTTPTRGLQPGLGRSVSNASAGADSVRRYGGLRRNVSVSSRDSTPVPSPGPGSSGAFGAAGKGSGVHRSNTLPSKKSPALSAARFHHGIESPSVAPPIPSPGGLLTPTRRNGSPVPRLAPAAPEAEGRNPSMSSSLAPSAENPPLGVTPSVSSAVRGQSKERLLPSGSPTLPVAADGAAEQSGFTSPKSRKVSSLLLRSPTSEKDAQKPRQPNKLRKKRTPSSTIPSAHSSTTSLQHDADSPHSPSKASFYTPLEAPGEMTEQHSMFPAAAATPTFSETAATPQCESAHNFDEDVNQGPSRISVLEASQQPSDSTLKAKKSPPVSIRSRSSVTDLSEQSQNEDHKAERAEKKHRWRFSTSTKKQDQSALSPGLASPPMGAVAGADISSSSVASWRKSLSHEPRPAASESVLEGPSPEQAIDDKEASEKKGPIGWLKAKMAERKEREAEKERAKSPQRDANRSASKQSLSAIANDNLPVRGRSADVLTAPTAPTPQSKSHATSSAKPAAQQGDQTLNAMPSNQALNVASSSETASTSEILANPALPAEARSETQPSPPTVLPAGTALAILPVVEEAGQ